MKRILTTLTIVLAIPVLLYAQQPPAGGLTVHSYPDGAEVTLTGDAVVAGVTPAVFQQLLIGEYHVTIKRHGYETYTTRVTLDPSKMLTIEVKLSPKTRLKAAARSLFIPGWGQCYGEQKGKGTLHTLLAAGALGAFLIADHDFQNKNDNFKASVNAYDSAVAAGGSREQLAAIQQGLATNQKKAYDAENTRRITMGVAIGVWSLSVLDALLFFPEDRELVTVKGVGLVPTSQSGTFGLALTKRF